MLVFVEEGKPEDSEKTFGTRTITNNKLHSHVTPGPEIEPGPQQWEAIPLTNTSLLPFLTRELRACARASYRYDVRNGIRSLDWSIPVNFF